MEVTCPTCGTPGQFAGKYCDNCGYSIPADAGQAAATVQADPDSVVVADPVAAPAQGVGTVDAGVPASGQDGSAAQVVGAQFAVVRDGQASLNEGFTLNRVGDFLVGRMDQETGQQVDIDLRQWAQPIEVAGQKQYLFHRKQCYINLADGDVISLRACPGAEADTLVRGPGESTFTSLQNLGTLRRASPDGGFELQLHDQVFIGDPDAVMYYQLGDPTAQGNYVVLELINKS